MTGNDRVPFFGTAREYTEHRHAILAAVDSVLSTGQMLQGPAIQDLERRLAGLSERRYAVAVGSCTDALYFGLLALGIGPGDEVLVPDFTFVASASAVLRTGARPVFVDVDENYNIGLADAATRVTPRTRALVFVHLFGLMGDPEKIAGFARQHRLHLIEDAAQALGASRDGRPAGSLGDVSCISFDPTKVVSAPGSGGVLLTNDEAVADKVRRLRYHGRGSRGTYDELGFNSQMPTLTAAVLNYKLDHERAWRKRRREVADRYRNGLAGLPLSLPPTAPGAEHVYHKFVLRCTARDSLRDALRKNGVETLVHYGTPLHQQPAFVNAEPQREGLHLSIEYAKTVLSLPIHPFLTHQEIDMVVDRTRRFFD